jgi:hypothetical protein
VGVAQKIIEPGTEREGGKIFNRSTFNIQGKSKFQHSRN